MKNFLKLILISIILVSCGDPDDNILDGDLITAITGVDSIFTSSSGSVDYEFTGPTEGFGDSTARIFAASEDDILIMNFRFNEVSDLTNIGFNNQAKSVSIEYLTYDGTNSKEYVIDQTAINKMNLFFIDKESTEGVFEFTMVNIEDANDIIQFKEGYLYVFD